MPLDAFVLRRHIFLPLALRADIFTMRRLLPPMMPRHVADNIASCRHTVR